jgi:hypothetical protein
MTDTSNADTSNSSNTDGTEVHHSETHHTTEPDGTFTDTETQDGKTTVEHGNEHSEGGEYTDSELTVESDGH